MSYLQMLEPRDSLRSAGCQPALKKLNVACSLAYPAADVAVFLLILSLHRLPADVGSPAPRWWVLESVASALLRFAALARLPLLRHHCQHKSLLRSFQLELDNHFGLAMRYLYGILMMMDVKKWQGELTRLSRRT